MASDATFDSSQMAEAFTRQAEAAMDLLGQALEDPQLLADWAAAATRIQALWLEFQSEQAMKSMSGQGPMADPAALFGMAANWWKALPLPDAEIQTRLWQQGLDFWQGLMSGTVAGLPGGASPPAPAPSTAKDKRFADPQWRDHPFFAMLHQTYLMACEQVTAMAGRLEGGDPEQREQLRFATQLLLDALSPSNFPLTNPQVLARAIETRGQSMVRGMENLLADLRRGQLTHSDPDAFRVGENIAVTPGKVVYQGRMFQLIHYAPATERVLEVPLVIFPPWINRFYILDLNPKKSFVRWAVEQGISVFMVSWKSADETMADVTWDDYVAAQIEAIDHIRERLKVPAVHAIGYCVAGTTLAATLAVLTRRGEADKVKSATFFTAQVDFSEAGDLLNFVDDQQIETIRALSPQGYLDGRYMAATFNLLRSNDLMWSYVVNHYLLGNDYPAFDLLHWNGDTTNLPLKWHEAYLRDLYRDNRLVVPDELSACGTPIDLRLIETPSYIQAGREDHIAPPESVWKLNRVLHGERTFVLAGSGHIAGVVNPPSSGKYQYWTNDKAVETLDAFVAGATEHPGSWWPHWLAWLRGRAPQEVAAKGKRKPGGKSDTVIEDAPGSFVRAH